MQTRGPQAVRGALTLISVAVPLGAFLKCSLCTPTHCNCLQGGNLCSVPNDKPAVSVCKFVIPFESCRLPKVALGGEPTGGKRLSDACDNLVRNLHLSRHTPYASQPANWKPPE